MTKLVDEIKVYVKAGDGGDGCASFRHEKYIPRGGPSGGDGGNGGNVYLQSTGAVTSLIHLTRRQHYYAERGGNGRKKCRHGKKGEDFIIEVPVGTILLDEDGESVLHDFSKGERFLIAEGGKGGKGNARFATSTNQAPRRAENGKVGEERWIGLAFRLMVDIAIIGLPNSGKSTLLSAITAAKSKTADYPFATKRPVLGMLELEDYRCFTVADMPSVVKCSHKGAGLGNRFLKHLERCKILLHVVDITTGDVDQLLANLNEVQNELKEADPELNKIRQIVILNKIDLIFDKRTLDNIADKLKEKNIRFCFISALKRLQINEMINLLAESLEEESSTASQCTNKLQTKDMQ